MFPLQIFQSIIWSKVLTNWQSKVFRNLKGEDHLSVFWFSRYHRMPVHCKCLQGFTGTLQGVFCNICICSVVKSRNQWLKSLFVCLPKKGDVHYWDWFASSFYEYGILLPKLFWPTVRKKNVLFMEKKFWNSRLKAENLQNFWDH